MRCSRMTVLINNEECNGIQYVASVYTIQSYPKMSISHLLTLYQSTIVLSKYKKDNVQHKLTNEVYSSNTNGFMQQYIYYKLTL